MEEPKEVDTSVTSIAEDNIKNRLKRIGLWERYQIIRQNKPEKPKLDLQQKPDTKPYLQEEDGEKFVNPDYLKEDSDLKIADPDVKQKDISKANGRTNYWKKRAEEAEKEAEAKLKEYEKELARIEEESKEWWKDLKSQKTIEEKRKALWEELGIKPKKHFEDIEADISEIEGIMENYNKKEAQRDAAIAQIQDRPGMPGAILSGEVKQIKNEYNTELNRMAAEINTQIAVMEMKQGNFSQARSFVNQAVDDYTYDLELKYTQFEMFKEENAGLIDDLDADYRNALEEAEQATYNNWQNTKEEKRFVLDLKLKTPGSGITIDDTPEEALEKAEQWELAQEELLSVSEAEAMGVPYGTSKEEAAQMGITPEYNRTKTKEGTKMISYPTASGYASMPVDTSNITTDTIEKFRKLGMPDADIYSWLDSNTNLTTGSIERLLGEAGGQKQGYEIQGGAVLDINNFDETWENL